MNDKRSIKPSHKQKLHYLPKAIQKEYADKNINHRLNDKGFLSQGTVVKFKIGAGRVLDAKANGHGGPIAEKPVTQGHIEAATEHAVAVQQPATRDPLLVAIVEASYRKPDSRAGELLRMIESDLLRGVLAVRLVRDEDFVRSALSME